MKLGFTLDFRNPLGRPWREHWEDNLWLMCEAEKLGFEYLLLQEHFFEKDGYGPSVPVFLAILSERTKRARIGSFISILPFKNPAHYAQEMAVLDHLSRGRLDVMVGAGHNPKEFAAFGVSPKTRPSRMDEGLTVLKKAWTQRPFSHVGTYFKFDEIGIYPEPCQKPHPPLWVGCTAPPAARRAARFGANLAAGTASPELFDAYTEALDEYGVARSGVDVSYVWSITTTFEPPNEVWQRNRALYLERWSFYDRVRDAMGDDRLQRHALGSVNLDASASDAEQRYRLNEVIGPPEMIIETLRQGCTAFPLSMVICSSAGGLPREEVYRNLQMFADHVMPEVKSWPRHSRLR